MNGLESLKKNREFQAVYQGGRSKVNKLLVMIVRRNHQDESRFGISVSKKVGNSVVRHRVIRIIREIMRRLPCPVKGGYDIVIVARVSCASRNYQEFESAVYHLLKLHHLLEDDDQL